ncbi:GNAT family N-acetyltransferase [Humibacter ginsenosidimutans]|uniref:GNAT family N-acetyltransferase n=1 Tax=Humibacter ginsenosidimutans TaxID=2599293 RepID=A0A5B8M5Z5_9MICO|nr:GNAT family protein [Humibacter ginsenosidimutans]QDZ15686.1 GNAT family N-acetyltransferase [Humibacter ginsenosidimutans]
MGIGDDSEARAYGAGLLAGDRIRLRALEEHDLPALVGWWRSPEWAVLQQLIVTPRPSGAVEEQFRLWSRNEKAGEVGFCVVDKASDELVGHVTLYGATLPARSGTLTVMIGGEFVGRGYGLDAVRTLTAYGFREMGLNRIEIGVMAFNLRARAVYRKAGYVEEGVRREAVFHDGAFHDHVIMSTLASEWRAASVQVR